MTTCRLFRGLTTNLLLWGLALWLGTAPVWAGEPTGLPLLRLETGMHTATIWRIATDAAGRWAVTASNDKTARIWNVASGEPVGVLRVPQDGGNEGKLYAVAMSPDGAQIAVGGWTGGDWDQQDSIYLFDRATQRLLRRISGLPNVIHHLAWSPDGRWLAVGLGGKNGVRVFDSASGQEIGRYSDYGDSAYSVEFSPSASSNGLRLLSASYDGKVRLHEVDSDGRLTLWRAKRHSGGEQPMSARFSPDGRWIAVGFEDSRVIQVLDAQDLSERARPDVSGVDNGDLGSVAWSADGRSLAAVGLWNVNGKKPMRRWSVGDWSRLGDVPLSGNTVLDLVALPKAAGGGWLFAGADPVWGVVNAQGQVVRRREGALADLRGQTDQLHLSADGRQLRFGYELLGKTPYRFDTSRRELSPETDSVGAALNAARTEAPGLAVKDWKNRTAPTLKGVPILALKYREISRSLAITPDGQRFALGTDWYLRFLDYTEKELWKQPVPDAVRAVNISADARWVVAAYADGTIRWHRIEDGKEVLAFFPHADRKRWVLWTPEGFYDAPPGAEDLIGYHLNRGKDREGEFISASQLRDHFYNPALITARLGPNGDQLMADAVKQLGNVETLLANARNVPPVVKLLSPERVEAEEETEVRFEVQARGGGVGALKFYVDGQPVEGRQMGVGPGETGSRRFKLAPGPHLIEVAGSSKDGVVGQRVAVNAVFSGKKTRGTLHLLAIGVERYEDKALTLKHSVRDAEQVAAEIAQRARPLFDNVATPVVLKDDKATLAGITQAFDQMRARFGPEDTLVIFLAGHGQARVGQFAFLPSDARRSADGALVNGLDETHLFQMLDRSPGRTLLLIDACDAGGMVELFEGAYERMGNVKKRAVIGASRRGQFALEGFEGHGVFTAALLQSLGKADAGEDLIVPTLYGEVKSSVTRISKQLKGGYQQEVKGYLGTADFAVIRR